MLLKACKFKSPCNALMNTLENKSCACCQDKLSKSAAWRSCADLSRLQSAPGQRLLDAIEQHHLRLIPGRLHGDGGRHRMHSCNSTASQRSASMSAPYSIHHDGQVMRWLAALCEQLSQPSFSGMCPM